VLLYILPLCVQPNVGHAQACTKLGGVIHTI
jgi:hypothetical protein